MSAADDVMALEGKAAVRETRQLNLAVGQGDFQKVRPIHANKRWTKIVPCVYVCVHQVNCKALQQTGEGLCVCARVCFIES